MPAKILIHRSFKISKVSGLLCGQFLSSIWFNQQLHENKDFHYNICTSQHIIISDTISKETLHNLYNKLLPETNDHIYISIPVSNYYWKIGFSLYKNNDGIIYIYCPNFETNHPQHISHVESSSADL